MIEKMNGAQVFFKTAVEGGIDTMFATPGTSEMQVIDELGYSDLKAVMCLFENSVTAMADGYGRMKRRPALALVHVGAGLTNFPVQHARRTARHDADGRLQRACGALPRGEQSRSHHEETQPGSPGG